MKVTYPMALDPALVEQCRQALADVGPGNPAAVQLEEGEDPKAVRRAIRAAAGAGARIRLATPKGRPRTIVVSAPDPDRPPRAPRKRRARKEAP